MREVWTIVDRWIRRKRSVSSSRFCLLKSFQQRANPTLDLRQTLRGNQKAGAFERLHETLVVNRLEKVIERLSLERLQRILVVRCEEHDKRRLPRRQSPQHVETVQIRHLNIEEDEIRRQSLDGRHGRSEERRVGKECRSRW